MEAVFWHNRWSERRIGFHLPQANPLLIKHWPTLEIEPNTPVFVPLCGKSQDMIWLMQQGHPVQGVELSRTAIEEFDQENSLQGSWSVVDGINCYQAGTLQIWHSDFFALSQSHTGPVDAVFDRAALIALPAQMRKRYCQHLELLASSHCKQLLICLEYEQAKREGPPFAVLEDEVATLYSRWHRTLLSKTNIEDKQPPSVDSVHLLRRHGDLS